MRGSTGAIAAVGMGILLATVGCSNTTGPNARHAVSLSVALGSGGATTSGSGSVNPAFDVTQQSGQDTLVLKSVSLVLDRLYLQSSSGSCAEASGEHPEADQGQATPDSADQGGESHADSATQEDTAPESGESEPDSASDHDGCVHVHAGPMLVQLPLDSAVHHVADLSLPAGTFTRFAFFIEPPRTEEPGDSTFLAAHPDLAGVSLQVQGTWNGQAFTFQRGFEAGEKVDLNPPLVVTDTTTSTNVTLSFDVRSWFRGPDGQLIDPSMAEPNGPEAGLVERNIRASLRGFEDADCDGHRDTGDRGD